MYIFEESSQQPKRDKSADFLMKTMNIYGIIKEF